MNDEQSRRLGEAADLLVLAADALDDARETLNDARFGRELERDRTAAAQQLASRTDAAGKRIEEALRKACSASAANGRTATWAAYRTALAAAHAGRLLARAVPDADGTEKRQAAAREAMASLEGALQVAADLVFAP